jgi:beta-galactosidase
VRFEIDVTGATAKSGLQLIVRYPNGKELFTTGKTPVKLTADGIVYADRTPLPNYYELQHNYSRAAVIDKEATPNEKKDGVTLHVRNRYDFLNLKDNVTFKWQYTVNWKTVAEGSFSPDCVPRDTVAVDVALPLASQKDGVQLLNIEISDK